MDIKYVKISDINESPIRHSELPSELIDRIRVFKAKLSEVELIPVETTINNFKCDKNPENEVLIWERIANAYTQYLHDNPSTELSFKKDVYSVLLRLTMGVSDFDHVKLTNEQVDDLFNILGITREADSVHPKHKSFLTYYFDRDTSLVVATLKNFSEGFLNKVKEYIDLHFVEIVIAVHVLVLIAIFLGWRGIGGGDPSWSF